MNDTRYSFIGFGAIATALYIGFFLIPGRISLFALHSHPVSLGESWKFLTYQMVHINIAHLLQNIIALALLIGIAIELQAILQEFSLVYITAGLFAVLPLWAFASFTALGASTAIFAGFGFLIYEAKKYNFSPARLMLIMIFLIFADTLANSAWKAGQGDIESIIIQDFAHLCGFLFGLISYRAVKKASLAYSKNKRLVLRRSV